MNQRHEDAKAASADLRLARRFSINVEDVYPGIGIQRDTTYADGEIAKIKWKPQAATATHTHVQRDKFERDVVYIPRDRDERVTDRSEKGQP